MKSLSFLLLAVILILSAGNAFSDDPVEDWVARYTGPGNYDDMAKSIALDGDGNVYVTGFSRGTGTYFDYATIKYDNDGEEQWCARYNNFGSSSDCAFAIAVDLSGNVYVTGTSDGNGTCADCATIKYNNDGVEQWVARYNSPADMDDYCHSIVLDEAGNVYVTGVSWSGSGIHTSDYLTIKYNNDGVEQWVALYNGPGNDSDEAAGISIDETGNVYVTGGSRGDGTYYDYATLMYNSDGVEQWVARYDGSGNGSDRAKAISTDDTGNVYVTGYSSCTGSSYDYATIKYNNDGVEQWIAHYNGPLNSIDQACAIVVDEPHNVYVTGSSRGVGTSVDYATIKYNSVGGEEWVARYNGLMDLSDEAYDIAIDSVGNVYVTGQQESQIQLYYYATIKYNPSGATQWVMNYYSPIGNNSSPCAIEVDGSANVYVTGWSIGTGADYSTIKYCQNLGIAPSQEMTHSGIHLFPIVPNPSTSILTVSFYIPDTYEVMVKIYDISGILVSDVSSGEYGPGLHQFQVCDIPSGVYFCHLQAGSVSVTEKLVVIQ